MKKTPTEKREARYHRHFKAFLVNSHANSRKPSIAYGNHRWRMMKRTFCYYSRYDSIKTFERYIHFRFHRDRDKKA